MLKQLIIQAFLILAFIGISQQKDLFGSGGIIRSSGGGSGTINSGTVNNLAYYTGDKTLDSLANISLAQGGLLVNASTTFTSAGNLTFGGNVTFSGDLSFAPTAAINWNAPVTVSLSAASSIFTVNNGTIRVNDGSAGTPAYSFTNDLNTGMFSGLSDVLGFTTGGFERARIDDIGRLGIGTTSPFAFLSVQGPSLFSGTSTFSILTATGTIWATHFSGATSTAAVSACGTGPVLSGGDTAGKIIIGGGSISSCLVTFGIPWPTPPACTATDETAILLVRAVTTQTTVTFSVATTFQGDTISYICLGTK